MRLNFSAHADTQQRVAAARRFLRTAGLQRETSMPQQVIFVDIDDTMVRSVGVKRIPMPAVIAQVRRLKAEGATLYLWSSGGAEYCRTTALELGITECFHGFLPKPTVYIDDQPLHEWRFCKHVYPSQAEIV